MKFLISLSAMLMLTVSAAHAQVELKTYADADGNIDVQTLTCAQLAGTFQEDADALTLWYNGWYNGLANTGNYNPARARGGEHAVIVYCKANPDKTVIQAIAVAIKQYRQVRGIKVKGEK